jgi:hypothetical protein
VPKGSLLLRKRHDMSVASEMHESDAALWLDVSWGKRSPKLYEQVYPQQNGYALILLSIEAQKENDEADDRNWNRH